MEIQTGPTRFKDCTGRILATQGAIAEVSQADMKKAIQKHFQGDWGDVTPDDAEANEQALTTGARIWSIYNTLNGVRFYIITEAADDNGNRAATTVLLPEEY